MNNIKLDFSLVHELIYELKVRDTMTSKLITAKPEDSLRDVQEMLRENRISGVPVVDEDQLIGIVSLEDIINALDKRYIEEKVEKWMTRNVITIRDNVSLNKAVSEFERHRVGRLPVVDENNKLMGIITRGDIVTRLMLELNKLAELHEYEEAQRLVKASTADVLEEEIALEVDVKAGDFDNAGIVSGKIKEELSSKSVDCKIIRRAAIATYETETNIILHSIGGKISAQISNDKITIKAVDWGPGIEDVEQAMQPGFSTASEFIRSLGFGAGMGLNNIQRCADEFEIKSTSEGTELNIEIFFDENSAKKV